MESIITNQDHNAYSGLLNSNYKAIVKQNFKDLKSNSLFSLKQRIRSNQFQTSSSIETTLKVALFLVALIIAFN